MYAAKEAVGMKRAIQSSILTALLLVVGAVAVQAGPPLNGIWRSTDGDFDEGTATTSWPSGPFPGAYLATRNVLYGHSTSGGVFTNDWVIGCPVVVSVTPLSPPVTTGNVIYRINYAGGFVRLGGPGNPWDGGDPFYDGTISTYVEIRTVQYVNHVIVGAVSDHIVTAMLAGDAKGCLTIAASNGVLRGTSPNKDFSSPPLETVKPADYPDYPDRGCVLRPGFGHWEDIRDITLSITGCTVKTEAATWGAVKSMYRD
jgi:hypothetical protein